MEQEPENIEQKEKEKPDIPFHPFRKRDTPGVLNTLLKNQYRMIARYLSLVDNKANIMIRLNSFIISGMVFLFTVIEDFTIAEISVLFLFIITSIFSLMYASLAARPIKTGQKSKTSGSIKPEENLFNVYADISDRNEFENAFDKMIRNQESIFKSTVNDLFVARKVLVSKFRRLRYSYNIFLGGISLVGILIILVVLFRYV